MQKTIVLVQTLCLVSCSVQPSLSDSEAPVRDPAEAGNVIRDAFYNIESYRNKNELTKTRKQDFSFVDSCTLRPHATQFSHAIEGAIRESLNPQRFQYNDIVRNGYGLPENSQQTPVSLLSHPLCEVTDKSVDHHLGFDKNGKTYRPNSQTMSRLKAYTSGYNRIRTAVLNKQAPSDDMVAYVSALMGCLAYEESLNDPGSSGEGKKKQDAALKEFIFDSAYARSARQAFNVSNASQVPERPEGVQFSMDRNGDYFILVNKLRTRNEWSQEVASQILKRIQGKLTKPDLFAGIKNKLEANKSLTDEEITETIEALKKSFDTWFVAGMYQFSPVPWGNIEPCITSWNELHEDKSRCQIKKDVGQAARALISSGQHFNTFCGVHKILHTFSTQANTTNPTGTDPANLSSGKLRTPKDRCLTLVSRAGKGLQYAHFGPLRNSVKGRVNTSTGEKIPDNMEGLFRCVASAVPEGLKTRYNVEL